MERDAMITTFALAHASLREKIKANDPGKGKRESLKEGQNQKGNNM